VKNEGLTPMVSDWGYRTTCIVAALWPEQVIGLVYSKKSKTQAVQSVVARRLENENVYTGPSDWVSWQKDNKVCFIHGILNGKR